ncbi:Kex protein, putative [Rhizoctonia solani AG-3 Rhs1AP]|uniref:Kex protein, putative n=2 Tax=Rhizoctonia solani AG-3 TaxID=1086053 RepID=X8J9C9_9AGAM|nr:Kex protein, putative [Rhizoctonia solani AG-3 Rhs1AP]KEP46860.1 putative Kex protein [Rhizoctonia solani 123E]
MLNGSASQPIRFGRATATIRTSLNPGLMYFRTQADQQPLDPIIRAEACDFIEDYRSGTVLDVVGSVGGLFALLHAAHVLLFGRPLLWGLTGAKLITPFGLLGACSSREFKRRLKDHYHKQSPENGSDTMRIGAFLRDFVIEFGPADIDIEHQQVQQLAPSTSTLVVNDKNADEIRMCVLFTICS